jgi:hypothetical protein
MAAIGIVLLNLIDGALTLFWVNSGVASEANPLMAEVVQSPLTFMATKLALVSLGMFLLFRIKRPRVTALAVTGCLAAYTWVFLQHLQEIPYLIS